MTNRTRTDSLLLAGFCAFLFFYGLGQFGLIGADEPRYAQVAREMLERHDWITPTLGGQPWLEKPPLYYWQAMLAYRIFGVSDWAARLPSAIDATFLVLAVYFFLRRFLRGFELDGALIAASSAGIMGYAHAASMDMALAAAFTDWHAGLVGVARKRKENLPRGVLWLHGFRDLGERSSRAVSSVGGDRLLRSRGSRIAAGSEDSLAARNLLILRHRPAVVFRSAGAQPRVFP